MPDRVNAICFSDQNQLEIIEEFRCPLQTVGSKFTQFITKRKLESTECNDSQKIIGLRYT